jgi:hypothetical protein
MTVTRLMLNVQTPDILSFISQAARHRYLIRPTLSLYAVLCSAYRSGRPDRFIVICVSSNQTQGQVTKLNLTNFFPNHCDTVCEGRVVSLLEAVKVWKLAGSSNI